MKTETEKLFALLQSSNNSQAYEALKKLVEISDKNNSLYPYMDTYIEMLDDDSSYVRTRGLILIAHNAKWDTNGTIDNIINSHLDHITDEKPICARQCIKLLPLIAQAKPNFIPKIISVLKNADVNRYIDSMHSLVKNDIETTLLALGA